MNTPPDIDLAPLQDLMTTAIVCCSNLAKHTREGRPDEWTPEDMAYVGNCSPALILNLILIAAAAKEWVDNPDHEGVRGGGHLRDAVGKIWK
jgi:hypothetical protein